MRATKPNKPFLFYILQVMLVECRKIVQYPQVHKRESTAMSFANRLAASRKKKGLNQTELAREIGVSAQSVQQWESGSTMPRNKRVEAVAKALGVSQEWLMFGGDEEGSTQPLNSDTVREWVDGEQPEEDEVDVPFYGEVELSAGNGATAVAEIRKAPIRFHRKILRSANVTPGFAACCRISGDSMEPILPDGATVGINTQETAIVDGKMYAIDHGGLLRVKTLQRLPGGKVLLRSANPAYGDEKVEMGDGFRVLGRVFWSSAVWH